MTKSRRLTELQRTLIATASVRPDGNLLPLPDSLTGDRDRVDKAMVSLLKRRLARNAWLLAMTIAGARPRRHELACSSQRRAWP